MSTEPRTLDLAPIQARCDAATPGPWDSGEDHHGQPTVYSGVDHWIAMLPHQCVEGIRQERERDAAFIAAARTDVPLLLAALRAERALVAAAMEQVDLAHAGNVETMNEANARVARLEAERDAARAMLNTPELHDFAAGVVLEAAHQRERWGADHDGGKTPADWFWLVGYLAGKALHALLGGNVDKALHHVITTAAALANWHAAISGTDSRMRPGIVPPPVSP